MDLAADDSRYVARLAAPMGTSTHAPTNAPFHVMCRGEGWPQPIVYQQDPYLPPNAVERSQYEALTTMYASQHTLFQASYSNGNPFLPKSNRIGR